MSYRWPTKYVSGEQLSECHQYLFQKCTHLYYDCDSNVNSSVGYILFNMQNVRGYSIAYKIDICTVCSYYLIRKLNVGQKPSVFGNALGTLQKVVVRPFRSSFSLAHLMHDILKYEESKWSLHSESAGTAC